MQICADEIPLKVDVFCDIAVATLGVKRLSRNRRSQVENSRDETPKTQPYPAGTHAQVILDCHVIGQGKIGRQIILKHFFQRSAREIVLDAVTTKDT
jgi:hypothetical protein